jgi:tetratricopeptide (TPR) repeat protein
MNMGRVSEARSDLDQLAAEGFSSSALTPIKADLAHMTDARDEEISAYERECQPLAPDDPVAKDPTAEASWLDGSKLASIRIKELRGDQKAAEEGWQKWLQEDDNAKFGMNEYGEYHIRQGNFEAAIKDFAACLAAMPKNQPSVDVTANVGLRLAEALWASGKLEEAEKRAAQVLELLREHKESTGRVSAFLAPSVFITLALAQQGFGVIDDKTSATLALSELVTAMKEEEYYGNGNIVAVLAGKLSKDKAANQLEKILKVAPNLDWALWSEMYLGFATAEDGQRALKFMPEHSLQRAILAQYLKGTSN